jgi:hypothetical protein
MGEQPRIIGALTQAMGVFANQKTQPDTKQWYSVL